MKIAYVTKHYAPFRGGVETHVEEIAVRMAAKGHVVEVLTQASDHCSPPVELIDGVVVRRFPPVSASRHYAFAPGLWSYLAREGGRYDVVHAHSYHALPALGAAILSRQPLVFTPHYHGTGHSRLRGFLHTPYRRLGAVIFARSRSVICVSQAESALVQRHFPRVSGRVTVIPNGVDSAALRMAEPFATDRTTILSVGRLESYKNVDRIIATLARLPDDFVLCIVGEGPDQLRLAALTARLRLQGRVRFLGRVDMPTLQRWFRTATVYVSMSSREAFGISLVEALAAGAGVVAADIPAYREIVAGIASGAALVPLDAPPATLASTIRDVAARRGASHEAPLPDIASWDDVAERTGILYQEVVARGARGLAGGARVSGRRAG